MTPQPECCAVRGSGASWSTCMPALLWHPVSLKSRSLATVQSGGPALLVPTFR